MQRKRNELCKYIRNHEECPYKDKCFFLHSEDIEKKKDKREKINIIKEKNSGQFEASNEKLKNFLCPRSSIQ